MKISTKNHLALFCFFIIFVACNPSSNSNNRKDGNANDNINESVENCSNTLSSENFNNTNSSSDDLYSQFLKKQEELKTISLPLEYSPSLINSIEFEEVPKLLFPIFELKNNTYDENLLSIARLPEHNNIKIVLLHVYLLSGQDVLFLSTFFNDKLADKIKIYTEVEEEYNGKTDALTITSFSITNNYEISIKTALYPSPAEPKIELNVKQKVYTINETGKFIEK